METKKCSKCGEVKILSEFDKRKGNICKKCICLSSKEWYENNKGKAIQYQKEHRKNNKEKIKQYHERWRKKNKEKIKQYNGKTRGDCHPCYITSNLKKQGFNKEQITPELIEENANIIKVKRIIKKINQSIN